MKRQPVLNPLDSSHLDRITLALFGLLIMSGLVLYFYQVVMHQPAFCNSCHNSEAEILSWELSSHSRFDCQACHQATSFSLAGKWIYYSLFTEEKFKMSFPVASSCGNCHSFNRQYTGELKIDHEHHRGRGVPCITCHISVVHGGIREETSGHIVLWEPGRTKTALGNYTRPPKQICFSCHEKEARAGTECLFCHKGLVTPNDHLTISWPHNHGSEAKAAIYTCNSCHWAFNNEQLKTLSIEFTAEKYARNNMFCSLCHLENTIRREIPEDFQIR